VKKIEDTLFIVQARLGSSRCKNKMIKPFAGSTLTSIALKKMKAANIPKSNLYLSAYESELKNLARAEEVNIFHRSEKSARWDGHGHLTEIFEWWDKLPYEHVIMVNACCPMLKIETIESFTRLFLNSENDAMFGVVRKQNYIWDIAGRILNSPLVKNAPDTKTIKPFYEAAHCLYAGSMKNIGKNIWMGDFTKQGDVLLYEIREEETFDIDYEWEFSVYENIYKSMIANKKGEIL